MDHTIISEGLARFGRLREREPLARHTTLRLGGPVRWLVEVDQMERAIALCGFLTESGVPWTVLGGGSNTIAADEGYDGVVVCPRLAGYEIGQDGLVVAEAGVVTALLARKVTEAGYTGRSEERRVGKEGRIGGIGCWSPHH